MAKREDIDNKTLEASVLKIIEKAVRKAIETVGIEGLKATSMFLSNARTGSGNADR